jgi:hypothetical protein
VPQNKYFVDICIFPQQQHSVIPISAWFHSSVIMIPKGKYWNKFDGKISWSMFSCYYSYNSKCSCVYTWTFFSKTYQKWPKIYLSYVTTRENMWNVLVYIDMLIWVFIFEVYTVTSNELNYWTSFKLTEGYYLIFHFLLRKSLKIPCVFPHITKVKFHVFCR